MNIYKNMRSNTTCKQLRSFRGMSLAEMMIVFVLIGIGIAAVIGVYYKNVESGKKTSTQNTIKQIKNQMVQFAEDTHNPVGKRSYDVLRSSSGTNPTITGDSGSTVWGIATASVDTFANHFLANGAGYTAYNANGDGLGWNGPYLQSDPVDQWNHNFYIGVAGFKNSSPVWICSAGPDGILQTAYAATAVSGDDLCERAQ